MARPRKTAEEKKLKGTYRKAREEGYKKKYADEIIKESGVILTAKNIPTPKIITDPYCVKYFQGLTAYLLAIGCLSGADIPQIEQIAFILQQLRKVEKVFSKMDITNEDFDRVEKSYTRLCNLFDMLATKYYVSPLARSKIRIEELTIKQKQLELDDKEKSVVSRVLENRIKHN